MTNMQSRHPETLTLSEFNRHMGYKGRFVYQLRNEGRLVMTEDGKLVRVAESSRLRRQHEDGGWYGSCAPWSAHQIDRPARASAAAALQLVVDVGYLLLQIPQSCVAVLDGAAVAAGGTGASELLLVGYPQAITQIDELWCRVVAVKSHAPIVGAVL
jgi:hypothetical protein